MFIFLYGIVIAALGIYSYSLIDPNLTLINHPWWVAFRDVMVQFGYYQREQSWYTYLAIVILLFIGHFIFIKKYKEYNPLVIGMVIGGILIFSYPFLSHDFFNYIFDAKIFTYYGENPYTHIPADYAEDNWLRFMQWTDRTYPYGPSYLVFSIIPSFFGFGKFILHFLFFKIFSVIFYLGGIYFLSKIDKKTAVIFATHPLIIIEGLVSAHNDLIGVSLAIIGIYNLLNNERKMASLYLILSAGIKYLTLPVILLKNNNKKWNLLVLIAQICLVLYLCYTRDTHAWYFLTFFAYLPVFHRLISWFTILMAGLLVSYYPYIYLGGWDTVEKVVLKKNIILVSLVINLIYLVIIRKEILQDLFESKLAKS